MIAEHCLDVNEIPQTPAERPTAALVAHDHKKAELVDFVSRHRDVLRHFGLFATGTTGQRIIDCCPDLAVTRLKSGPLGGDQQIGALIAEGRVGVLFFFVDPLSPHPHDVDVKALMRVSLVYDIPMALNRATAERLIRTYAEERRLAAGP